MQVNLRGRVKNVSLARSNGLRALFEAVINSRDAIRELGDEQSDHHIEVRILRKPSLFDQKDAGRPPLANIRGFEIEDDGVGFNDDNFAAFQEADTQRKADQGGRGVGRFLWLKAFDKVEVDSVYLHDGGAAHRKFDFSLNFEDGIGNLVEQAERTGLGRHTTVRLLGFKEDYETSVPRSAETIAQRIVEHCLVDFLLRMMPPVTVHDSPTEETIDLGAVYEGLLGDNKQESVDVDGQAFEVAHFTLNSYSGGKHAICYCANRRLVRQEPVGTKVHNLPERLTDPDSGKDLLYVAYVTSPYLDKHVNQERAEFDVVPDGTLPLAGEPTWQQIEADVLNLSREFLKSFTDAAMRQKNERVSEFVRNEGPEYRWIVEHHPETLEEISPDASSKELDEGLHKIQWQCETELRARGSQLLDDLKPESDDQRREEQLQRFSEWWEDSNAAAKANLAKYIVQRKVVLQCLEKALAYDESGRYAYEDVIHNIIFPLKRTSDDVTYEDHNLWVLDEKLCYHEYLASDMSLKSVEPVQSDDESRADLVIFFDRPIAVAEGDLARNSGIVIFEFKRPMRDDYGSQKNPIDQVLEYVEKIRAAKVKTKNGRPMPVSANTPFYCYVVADLTDGLKSQAIRHGLTETPDGEGFFGYNPGMHVYIEVMSLERLLRDAKRRNHILFEKLGLPAALVPASDAPADESATQEQLGETDD